MGSLLLTSRSPPATPTVPEHGPGSSDRDRPRHPPGHRTDPAPPRQWLDPGRAPWGRPKGHTGAILVDHLLDDDRHAAEARVQGQLLAVEQRRIGPEGGPYDAQGIKDSLCANDADDRFMQAGKRAVGRIFSRRRRPNSQRFGRSKPLDGSANDLGQFLGMGVPERLSGSAEPRPRSPPSAWTQMTCGRAPYGSGSQLCLPQRPRRPAW